MKYKRMRLHMERIDHTAPPKHVARLGLSNKTPLSRTIGMLHFNCELCGVVFEKPAAWAKRVSRHYCSRECCSEDKKVRIHTNCRVCGVDMEQTPSEAVKTTTCGKICSSRRRRSGTPRPHSFVAYKNEMVRIAKAGVCSQCGVQHGPWVVRGIKSELVVDAMLIIDHTSGSLWCRPCHFRTLGVVGGRARQKQIRERKTGEDDRL
jgi:hypothetical protein